MNSQSPQTAGFCSSPYSGRLNPIFDSVFHSYHFFVPVKPSPSLDSASALCTD
ncbi:hypothetical protein H0H93_011638 [Arthromyces matolae]|nr:hypothetical protein H0H93_011638 [Arthromyces matolae]